MGQITPDSKSQRGQQSFSTESRTKLQVRLLVLLFRIHSAFPCFPLQNHPHPQQPVHVLQAEPILRLHEGVGAIGVLQTVGHSLRLAMGPTRANEMQ